MSTILLLIIYIAFISLGLPDSVLGTAWPLMHLDLNAPIGAAGAVNILISLCTIISSLSSQRIIKKFGTYLTTAISIVLTFVALYLFSAAGSFYALLLFAIPLGLGAGSIDTALNNYVAKHYSAMQMNFLHAFWGIGTIIAPILLSFYFESGKTWRDGYLVLAIIQSVIFILVASSKKLWKREEEESEEKEKKIYSIWQLIRVPGALFSALAFTFYTFEGTSMLWLASYLVYGKAVSASTAAAISSMIYLGITCGRISTAFIADKVKSKKIILTAQVLIILALIALIFTDSASMLYVFVFILGFSYGPCFPTMVRQTVSYFKSEYSVGIIGLQMSFTYLGNMVICPLYGVLSSIAGTQLIFPFYMLFLVVMMAVCTTMKNRLCKK